MGAICVTSRREEAAKQAADAEQHEQALSVPKAEPAAESASSASCDEDKEKEEEAPPPPPPPPSRLSFRLVPPAALSAAAAEPFDFGGKVYSPRAGGRVAVAVPPDLPCERLLDFCAAWLRVPPESLSVQGPRLTLSPASPRRTAEQAGLGEVSPSGKSPAQSDGNGNGTALAEHPVFSLPFCCICLEAASGAVWACRAAQRHVCCGECARRYAATRIVMRPTAAALHCPVPGCPHTLLNSIQLQRLVNTEDVRAARAQRIADQAERLRRIATGQEGAELAAMLRRRETQPCPTCHALIEKNGGCHHVTCSACGTCFDWA